MYVGKDAIPVKEDQATLSFASNAWGTVVVRIALLSVDTALAMVRGIPPPFCV